MESLLELNLLLVNLPIEISSKINLFIQSFLHNPPSYLSISSNNPADVLEMFNNSTKRMQNHLQSHPPLLVVTEECLECFMLIQHYFPNSSNITQSFSLIEEVIRNLAAISTILLQIIFSRRQNVIIEEGSDNNHEIFIHISIRAILMSFSHFLSRSSSSFSFTLTSISSSPWKIEIQVFLLLLASHNPTHSLQLSLEEALNKKSPHEEMLFLRKSTHSSYQHQQGDQSPVTDRLVNSIKSSRSYIALSSRFAELQAGNNNIIINESKKSSLFAASSDSIDRACSLYAHNLKIYSSVSKKTDSDNDDTVLSTLLALAKLWNSVPSDVTIDHAIANGLLFLLKFNRNKNPINTHIISSSSLAAAIPIGLRLLDRYEEFDQCLGLVLLDEIISSSSSTLLFSSVSWFLPQILISYRAISGHCVSLVLTCRLIQSILSACSSSTSFGKFHSHRFISLFNEQILLKRSLEQEVMPLMLAMYPFLQICSRGILHCQLADLVDVLLSLINRWHLPVQSVCVLYFLSLLHECAEGMRLLVPKVVTEMLRIVIFYDISATKESITTSKSGNGSVDVSVAPAEEVRDLLLGVDECMKRLRDLNPAAVDKIVMTVSSALNNKTDCLENLYRRICLT